MFFCLFGIFSLAYLAFFIWTLRRFLISGNRITRSILSVVVFSLAFILMCLHLLEEVLVYIPFLCTSSLLIYITSRGLS